MTAPDNGSRKHQREQTRRSILQAAIYTFAEQGFDAASLSTIAERAGCKKALVQYHFATKDKLWQEAVIALWQQRDLRFSKYMDAIDAKTASERLRQIFHQIILFSLDNPAWLGIMFREAASGGPRMEWMLDHCIRKDFKEAEGFIVQGQADGLLPKLPATHLLQIISGALFYPILVGPLTARVYEKPELGNTFIEPLLDTLMALLQGAVVADAGIQATRAEPTPR